MKKRGKKTVDIKKKKVETFLKNRTVISMNIFF